VEATEPGGLKPGVGAAAQRLRIDYVTAEVLRALDAAGVPSILLKGASVVRWLYEPDEPRAYGDCDLLVPAGGFDAAAGVLAELGFEAELDEEAMPDWWREHGLAWFRPNDRAAVDLHRTLPGVQVDARRLWDTLAATTESVVVGGSPARTLAPPGRAMHVALHAAQHGDEMRQPLADLERALQRADEETWRQAAELAAALGATAALATGLRLLTSGAALADRLGLESDRSSEVALRAEAAAEALTVERVFRARGFRGRLSIIRHKLAPPPTFMRKWSPLARRNRLGLVAAYVWRPIWIMIRAPSAVRAWWDAHRTARHPEPGRKKTQ
jgi:hypothetical protein